MASLHFSNSIKKKKKSVSEKRKIIGTWKYTFLGRFLFKTLSPFDPSLLKL